MLINEIAMVDINNFDQVRECIYKGERYSVRDNGAIFRHQRDGKRIRLNDNQWTFGKENTKNPYLLISNTRVHRIVATAFHGEPPDPKYVVDHIDTNCKNNRPENLRWLSRLENALKNPITRKKIEYLCGSIEAFLKNPSILNDLPHEPNFKWMRAVTTEEAQNCMQRMALWTKPTKEPSKSINTIDYRSSFNKRALKPLQKWEAGLSGEPGLDFALTPWCGQYMWEPAHFPCCPHSLEDDIFNNYYINLKNGTIFAYNDNNSFPQLTVYKSAIINDQLSIIVMCERADNNWAIVGIMLNKKSHFIHFYLGSYINKNDAEGVFNLHKEKPDFWRAGYNNSWEPI